MKFLKYVVLSLLVSFCANAKDILFINGASPTGGQTVYAKEIANELRHVGFNANLKTTNLNCAIAKNLWDNSTIPTIFITATNIEGTTQKDNQLCFVETTPSNYLYWLNDSITSFCSAGSKTWQDFLDQSSTHTIVTMAENTKEKFIKELVKHFNIKARILRVHSSNDMLLMVKSGEIDYVFRDSVHMMPEFKDKCFWNHKQIDHLFPQLVHLQTEYTKFNQAMFLMQKGFTELEKIAIQRHLKTVMQNNFEIKKQIERRGQIVNDWTSDVEFNTLMTHFFKIY